MSNSVSAERSLVGSVVVSVLVALVASRLPQLSFGSFTTMVVVLIAANVVVYVLMKMGLFRSLKD